MSASLYSYAAGNPVTNYDPDGQFFFPAVVAGAAAGFAGGFLGSIFEQGIGQAFGRSQCPIDPVKAIYTGLAAAAIGAAAPGSYAALVLGGAYSGVIVGILTSVDPR
jgi:hypothetical protein